VPRDPTRYAATIEHGHDQRSQERTDVAAAGAEERAELVGARVDGEPRRAGERGSSVNDADRRQVDRRRRDRDIGRRRAGIARIRPELIGRIGRGNAGIADRALENDGVPADATLEGRVAVLDA